MKRRRSPCYREDYREVLVAEQPFLGPANGGPGGLVFATWPISVGRLVDSGEINPHISVHKRVRSVRLGEVRPAQETQSIRWTAPGRPSEHVWLGGPGGVE